MSFTYVKMTDEEIEAARGFKLLDTDNYQFKVTEATFRMSNTGKYADPSKPSNPMIELVLLVWDKDGREYFIKDYLVSIPSMMWKIKHFCTCVGLQNEYENQTFNESMCEGKHGYAHITVQKGKVGDNGTKFNDRNVVAEYLSPEDVAKFGGSIVKESEDLKDDDLPF